MKVNKDQTGNSSLIEKRNLNEKPFFNKEEPDLTSPKNMKGVLVRAISFIILLIAAYIAFTLQSDFAQYRLDRSNSSWGFAFFIIAAGLFLFKAGFFFYNLYLYFKYKPVDGVEDNKLPTTTVIVPAFNEGKQVWATLMSLAESDYPEEKLQLLAIDDGSKDDTWYWMQEAKKVLGSRLAIYQQPVNKGKRHALYRGFNLGKGEIFVTVDSDSIIAKDTLRNLVSPFVVNEKCGAVAGNIRVLNNEQKALLPKMLDVSFVLSFEFVRSAESTLESVLCTPGALAAYRSEAVFACLDDWINQTFMGNPSDIGEDRAMTNMILKQGYHVQFQRNAYAYTNVPEKYTGLYKMFIRWGRSNVRENLNMAKYVFTDFREGKKLGIRILFLNQILKLIMSYPVILLMFFFIFTHPILFLSSTLLSILIWSSFPVLFYAKRYTIRIILGVFIQSFIYFRIVLDNTLCHCYS